MLLCDGTVKDIAYPLNRSEKTVEAHSRSLCRERGFNNRALIARWAIREGLIEA